MFNFSLEKTNQEKLESSLRKNMMYALGKPTSKFARSMFDYKTILASRTEEMEYEPVEPGEDIPFRPDIIVETNKTNDTSYIVFTKELLDSMNSLDVNEMIYQFYNTVDRLKDGETSFWTMNTLGDTFAVNVAVNAKEYEDVVKEAKEEGGETSSEDSQGEAEKDAEELSKELQKASEAGEETKQMSDQAKEANPNYADAMAGWETTMQTSSGKFFQGGRKSIDKKHAKEIHEVEGILEYAIQGDGRGKAKSITPSKRINMHSVITESSDREYIIREGDEGKDININLIIDRSGSMSGRPTRESNILTVALNNLAFEYPELRVKVILSESSNYASIDLPIDTLDSSELWRLDRTGGGEGLTRTMEHYAKEINDADINLIYTDGSIVGDPIPKAEYAAKGIDLIGMYVDTDFTPGDILKHIEKNSRYFMQTIIRSSMVELISELGSKIDMVKRR